MTVRRALIIINPAAGNVTGELSERVVAACSQLLAHVDVTHARGIEATMAAAAQPDPPDVILAVGGDATACEVAEGLARAGGRWNPSGAGAGTPALLPIPAGRGNSAYHAIWGDTAWESVLEAVVAGAGACVRPLDLLRIHEIDRGSLLGLNAGLLARIVRLAADEPATGTALERYSAVMPGVLEVFRAFDGRVIVDGECLHEGPITQLTVGGLRRWAAGVLEFLPRSVLDDGLLDVCVIGEIPGGIFGDLGSLLTSGAHLELPYVTYAQGRSVTIERLDGEPLELEHDGDAWTESGPTVTLEALSRVVGTYTPVVPAENLYSRAVSTAAAAPSGS
jgi:diacylglycerol kinase (ATP)